MDTAFLDAAGIGVTRMAEAVAASGGIRIAQYRHKGPFTRARFEQARQVAAILEGAGVRFVLNDRADMAMALGAGGVHVGQEDLLPSVVRRLVGGGMLLGYSTHSDEQLAADECRHADYLAIGPVFRTVSKREPDPVVGLDGVARAAERAGKPLVAIGGITLGNARSVLDSGADCVAMIAGVSLENLGDWVRLEAERCASAGR